ncbi:MAG TPA: hypothetical protein PKX93_07245 [bacterium]|nr:hypothetical protein [bacterium]HOL67233.1 hypothetical protein [bacterium]HPP12309.1 hypothetical protein [bacterium]
MALILVAFNGYLFYHNYRREQARRQAEEQKRLAEEEARKKQERILQEKKKEFEQLLAEMKKLIQTGCYGSLHSLGEQALALARTYHFSEEEVKELLRQMDTRLYLSRLTKLEKLAQDIFQYQHIREQLRKIPRLPAIQTRWDKLLVRSYLNEYLACLELAEKTARQGLAGQDAQVNYSASKMYLGRARQLRKQKTLTPDEDRERTLMALQSQLFFKEPQFQETSTPGRLYRSY